MDTLFDHLEGVVAVVAAAVGLIAWFVRLEMKTKELSRQFTECRSQKIHGGDIHEKVHAMGDDIKEQLTKILERLARVETKLDRNGNGGER